MENKLLLSVCIPTYNQTYYLKKALDSLTIQTYQSFELIISDDSTTEDVFKLVNTYRVFFGERLIYIKNSPAFGSPQNWNESIRVARGEFIKILHHDEWLLNSTVLEKLLQIVIQNPQSFVFAGIKGTIVREKRTYTNLPTQEQIYSIMKDPFSLIWANIIGPPSTILFKRTDVEFDKQLLWLVDIDFYLQLLINKKLKLHLVPEVLFENCQDEHNITNQCWQNKALEIKEFMLIFKKFNAGSGLIEHLKFLRKLKKHISSYSKVTYLELFLHLTKMKL